MLLLVKKGDFHLNLCLTHKVEPLLLPNPTNNPQNYHEQAKSITTLRSGKTYENLNVPPPTPSPTQIPIPSSIIPLLVEKPIPLEKEKMKKKLKKKKNVS